MCKRCGILGHIARRCTNPVDASFGEEEQWAAANAAAEENAATLEDNAAAEDNATSLENEATEVAAWYVCNLSIFCIFSLFYRWLSLFLFDPALG